MQGFQTIGSSVPWIEKAPGAMLDYVIDFSDLLDPAETLAGITPTVETGLTVGSSPAPAVNAAPLTVTLKDGAVKNIATGKAVIIWLGGGTENDRYRVTATCPVAGSIKVVEQAIEIRVAA